MRLIASLLNMFVCKLASSPLFCFQTKGDGAHCVQLEDEHPHPLPCTLRKAS